MKKVYLLLFVLCLLFSNVNSQTVNQLTIVPALPTTVDTILIISDFSYYGDCSFGLVYSNYTVVGSVITLYPLFCGYGAPTLCNSVDTFKIDPLPAGSYSLEVEYHQGSVCPVSGFDAIIAQLDTMMLVDIAIGVPATIHTEMEINITHQNDVLNVSIGKESEINKYQVKMANLAGQILFQSQEMSNQFHIPTTGWSKTGIYFLSIIDTDGSIIQVKKILIPE